MPASESTPKGDVPGFEPANIQRGLHDQFNQGGSVSFGARDLKFAAEIGFHIWNSREGFFFGVGYWTFA